MELDFQDGVILKVIHNFRNTKKKQVFFTAECRSSHPLNPLPGTPLPNTRITMTRWLNDPLSTLTCAAKESDLFTLVAFSGVLLRLQAKLQRKRKREGEKSKLNSQAGVKSDSKRQL